jgi:hypothetical protein
MPQPCLIARTQEEREQVFRLRYTCYRSKGAIDACKDERFSDHFDDAPNSFSFLARAENEQRAATVRISVVRPVEGWEDSPGQHVFGDHPAMQALRDESYVEASRLCFGRQARRDSFVGLLGYMVAMAEFYEVGWFMACPREEHAEVYQRMFGFRQLAEPRQYFGVNFRTQLLGVRREELKSYVRDRKVIHEASVTALETLRGVLGAHSAITRSCGIENPGDQVRQWTNTLGRCFCEEDFIPQSAFV